MILILCSLNKSSLWMIMFVAYCLLLSVEGWPPWLRLFGFWSSAQNIGSWACGYCSCHHTGHGQASQKCLSWVENSNYRGSSSLLPLKNCKEIKALLAIFSTKFLFSKASNWTKVNAWSNWLGHAGKRFKSTGLLGCLSCMHQCPSWMLVLQIGYETR